MKAIAKNFGKFNQYVGEKFSNAQKHELSEEFKEVEAQLEVRKDGTDDIFTSSTQYLKTLDKKKEGVDKQKRLPIDNLGIAMIQYGSDLHEESAYGQALVKMGAAEAKIGVFQAKYADSVRSSFIAQLEVYMTEMKNFKHLRSKLESRRLDYDAKMNKIQKSKKENPSLDEEMRVAQQKYEETLEEVERMMVTLNDNEEPQMEALLQFVDAQCEYHQAALSVAEQLRSQITDTSVKGERMKRAQKFKKSSTSLSASSSSIQATPTREVSKSRNDITESAVITGVPLSNMHLSVPQIARPLSAQSSSQDSSSFNTPQGGSSQNVMESTRPLSSQEKKMVRANYSFVAENKDELTINKGDLITVVQEIDPGWWIGEINGQRGMFPANYCTAFQSDENQQRLSTSSNPSLPPSNAVPKFNYFEMPNLKQQATSNTEAPSYPPVNYGSKPPNYQAGTTPPNARREMSRSNSGTNLI